MMAKSSFLKQFTWVISSRVLAAVIQAVTVVAVARSLGPADFGLLMAVISFTIVGIAVSDLGMQKLIVAERARDKRSLTLNSALRLNTAASALLALVTASTLSILGLLIDRQFFLLIPLAVSSAAEKISDTRLGVPIADGNVRPSSTNLVVRRLISLSLFLIFTIAGVTAMLSYTAALAIAALASVIYARFAISNLVHNTRSSNDLGKTLRAGRSYWINTLFSQLRTVDVPIVSMLSGPTQAGLYASSARLTSPITMLTNSAAIIILPHSFGLANHNRRVFVNRLLTAALILAVLHLLFISLVPFAIPIVLGESYGGAIIPLQIAIAGLVFFNLSTLLVPYLQGSGFEREVAFCTVSATSLAVVLVAGLAYLAGAMGASIGMAVAQVVEAAVLASVLFRGKELRS